MYPTETNIVIIELENPEIAQKFHQYLKEKQVLSGMISKTGIRFVTHLDFGDEHLTRFLEIVDGFSI